MPVHQVGVIKIVLLQQGDDPLRIYADTFVGPDEDSLQRDGHHGLDVSTALGNATQWAAKMLEPDASD